jgi:hypothetical protein
LCVSVISTALTNRARIRSDALGADGTGESVAVRVCC